MIQELPTDRNFLDLSETCLYMVHFAMRHTSENSKKTRNISLPEDVNNEILLSKI